MVSGRINFFLALISSEIDKTIRSPPLIKVAELAITVSTVTYCFFSAFFNADFVAISLNIPTPYSCSRMGAFNSGTI